MQDPQLSPNLRPLRYCPNCGQRLAQKADSCFMCGHRFGMERRRRLSAPIGDLVLLAVVLGVAYLWWTRSPQQDISTAAAPIASAPAAPTAPPNPTTVTPLPTATATATPSATVALSATLPLTPTVTPTPVVYTVVRGDTVEKIAQAFGVSVQDLMAANGMTSDLIRVDEKLVIPTGPVELGPDGKPVPTATPTPVSAIYKVEVRPGDTLEAVAKRLHTTVDAIVAANDWVKSADTIIIPGDILIVPVGEAVLTPIALDTVAPTATPVPTPTATPGPRWPAPQLLTPVDEAAFEQGDVLLQWLSVGVLASDERYVVRVMPEGQVRSELIDVTVGNSYRIPQEWLERQTRRSNRFFWRVQVVRDVRSVAGETLGLRLVSDVGQWRSFSWSASKTR